MPILQFCCEKNQHFTEQFFTMADAAKLPTTERGNETILCPECGEQSVRQYLTQRRAAILGAPTVVFMDSEGKPRFPGRDDEPTPNGYVRVELTTMKERRDFAAKMDSESRRQWEQRMEREQQFTDEMHKYNRGELFNEIKSNQGRDFLFHAIEQTERARAQRYGQRYESGCRFEVAE